MAVAKRARAAGGAKVARKRAIKRAGKTVGKTAGNRLGELVRAHAVLRLPLGERKTTDQKFEMPEFSPPSAALVEKSRIALEQHGFRVIGKGAASLTIEAKAELFQKVFKSQVRHTATAKRRQGLSHPVRFSTKPIVPDDLDQLIETVAFPEPTELY